MLQDNDKRGWILACVSGLACVVGSSIICLDLLCLCVPRWRGFSIRENTTFLAASLSLSFGVMIFSAMYRMLPEAHHSFLKAGFNESTAGYAIIFTFLGGVLGLQVVSELLHCCLPSSIVKCDEHGKHKEIDGKAHCHASEHPMENGQAPSNRLDRNHHHNNASDPDTEVTPLLARELTCSSLKLKFSHSASALVGKNRLCDANGKCYGYSDHPCEQKCSTERVNAPGECSGGNSGVYQTAPVDHDVERSVINDYSNIQEYADGGENPGHHHVAKNKFLSIGVQTSIAIALHKVPEGFITYASNHANPKLGLAVFIAIFIHNIAEGFAMSLPLFLALQSRFKAILWASLLGGLAQPLGALIAAISLDSRNEEPNPKVQGYILAVTAGIMCSVGLQLYAQADQIHHNQRVPQVFAFLGMGILGVSVAITA